MVLGPELQNCVLSAQTKFQCLHTAGKIILSAECSLIPFVFCRAVASQVTVFLACILHQLLQRSFIVLSLRVGPRQAFHVTYVGCGWLVCKTLMFFCPIFQKACPCRYLQSPEHRQDHTCLYKMQLWPSCSFRHLLPHSLYVVVYSSEHHSKGPAM